MISALLIWSYILFILIAYGLGTLASLQRVFDFEPHPKIPLPLMALLGLGAVNFLSALLSLIIPLGIWANLIVLGGACILFFKYRTADLFTDLKLDKASLGLLAIAGLSILENATHVPSNPDTPLYHAQAIHWIESYRAVPGLGNLHNRFAFDSNWLVVNALFSFAFLRIQSFHLLPGIFFFIVIFYFLSGVPDIVRGNFSLTSLFKILLIPISFHVWASEISSPGTDLPATLLIWVVISLWLEVSTTENRMTRIAIFILSLTAITFKVSAFPILLLSGYDFLNYLRQKQFKFAWNVFVIGFIIFLPWMLRNFVISGYWVYPVPAITFLTPKVDWQMPADIVTREARRIQFWARQFDVKDQSPKLPWQWMPFWLSRLTLIQRLIFWIPFLFLPIYGLIVVFDKRVRNMAYLCCYIGILFWLLSAPNIRFGYGFLIAADLLVLIPIPLFFLKRPNFGVISILLTAFYLGVILIYSFESKTFVNRVVYPEPYPEFPTVYCGLANATIQCAEKYNLCGYSAFPCAPKGDSAVEMRGADWQNGFRTIQP